MIEYLALEDVLTLIDDLGVGPVRDVGLLDSAVHRPQASVFGVDAYPNIDEKAAALLVLQTKIRARFMDPADGTSTWRNDAP